jgi:hypothetical protein
MSYVSGPNLHFEHIRGIAGCYAGLTGSIRYFLQYPYVNNIMPIYDGWELTLWHVDTFYETYFFFGIEIDGDGNYSAVKLIPVLDSGKAADFFTPDDRLYGGIVPVDEGVSYIFRMY